MYFKLVLTFMQRAISRFILNIRSGKAMQFVFLCVKKNKLIKL